MDPGPFYLGDVMSEAVAFFKNRKQNRQVEIIVSAPPLSMGLLIGDPLRIQQVLLNLINNAIKFTDHGEIIIRVEPLEQSEGHVTLQFSVQDTGIGLTQEQIDKLFAPFMQADASTTRKYGGTGLGLAICKRLVEMMEGRIWVESQISIGSTFFFTTKLGVKKTEQVLIMEEPEEVASLNILVVDDHQVARQVLCDLLASMGISSHSVSSGGEALTRITSAMDDNTPYDLVFIDWPLVDIDVETWIGMVRDLLHHAPNHCGGLGAKMIAMNAFSGDDMLQRARRLEMDAVLTKPMTPSTVMGAILEAFGKSIPSLSDAGADNDLTELIAHVGGAHVLLVEDNLINQTVAGEILGNLGLEVTIANHGQEALDILMRADAPFELVLMDVQMPVMDGYQATRAIRDQKRFKELPIVAMTAHALIGDRQRCLASGMDDYVTKPIILDKFHATLKRWIQPIEREVDLTALEKKRRQHEKSADELPDTLPGLDAKGALNRLGGNGELLKKMWFDFTRDYATFTEKLKEILQEKSDLQSAQQAVHGLKGVAGNLGAIHLHQSAKELETAIKENRPEDWRRLFDDLQESLNLVMVTISSLKNEEMMKVEDQESTDTVDAAPLDKTLLQSLFTKLGGWIHEGNIDAGLAAQELCDHLKGHPEHAQAGRMMDAIDNFDFAQAAEEMHSLSKVLKISI